MTSKRESSPSDDDRADDVNDATLGGTGWNGPIATWTIVAIGIIASIIAGLLFT